jgi:hypothetical protein
MVSGIKSSETPTRPRNFVMVSDFHAFEQLSEIVLGRLIASRTEKEVFAALGVPWQEPHQRNRG